MIDEIWKDVVGFEGLYQVSNKGRPVYTHEIPFLDIQEKSKEDFIALCRGDSE